VLPAVKLEDDVRARDANCGAVTEITPPVREKPRDAHGMELVLGPVPPKG